MFDDPRPPQRRVAMYGGYGMLRLWLLGPWRAWLAHAPLASLPTRHARALLARLALSHPHPLSREQLQRDLFGAAGLEHAAHLRTTLYYLRRVLGERLLVEDHTLALAPTLQVEHDVAQFLAGTRVGATFEQLRRAVRLYRGSFLDNPTDGWAAEQAQQLHALYIDAVRRLATLAVALDERAAVIEAAQRWVAEEPWEERSHVMLLEALIASGLRAEAEAQLVRSRQVLRVELGRELPEAFEAFTRTLLRLPQPLHPPAQQAIADTEQALSTWERLPLVGRAAELEQLRAGWARAQQGAGGVWIVSGAEGVGKTRLVHELAEEIRHQGSGSVLWGVANGSAAQQPFQALRDALARAPAAVRSRLALAVARLSSAEVQALSRYAELAPWLPAPVLAEATPVDHARQSAALLQLLRYLADQQPLLLVLEDIYHADAAMLQALQALSRAAGHVLVVLTCRASVPEQMSAWPVLRLAPLGAGAVAELLNRMLGMVDAGLAAQIAAQSQGYPRFIYEILRMLVAERYLTRHPLQGWQLCAADLPLPTRLTELFRRRLQALAPPALFLARLLAVLDRPAEAALLEALWPDNATRRQAQIELLDQGVAIEQAQRLALVHPCLAELLLFELDAPTRTALHAQIAAALQRLPQSSAAERMRHHAAAAQWPAALTDALLVGEQALAEDNYTLLDSALQIATPALATLNQAVDADQRWRWLCLRERHLALSEGGVAWSAALDELYQAAIAAQRPDRQVQALLRRGQAQQQQGKLQAARETLRQAAALAHQQGLLVGEIHARLMLAYVLNATGATDAACDESETAKRLADTTQDPALIARSAIAAASLQMYVGQVDAAHQAIACLEADALVRSQPQLAVEANITAGLIALARRNYEAAFDAGRAALRHAHGWGDSYAMFRAQSALTSMLIFAYQFEAGRWLADVTVPLGRRLGHSAHLAMVVNHRAMVTFYAGELHEAAALAEESTELAETLGTPEYAAYGLGLRARIALALGNLSEARSAIERAGRYLQEAPRSKLNLAHIAAQIWLALGERERALVAARTAVARAIDQGLSAHLTPEALWEAAMVLDELVGTAMGEAIRARAYARFVDDVSRLGRLRHRRAFIRATPIHRAIAEYNGHAPRRLVWLPLRDAPTGRPLYPDEQAPVIWTIQAPDDPPWPAARRRRQLLRLADEAIAQGALATVEALAAALTVSARTIKRDLKALREEGVTVITRGTLNDTERQAQY